MGSRSLRAGVNFSLGSLVFVLAACTARLTHAAGDGDGTVRFNRDVRPILSAKCFLCHGLDEESRAAGLRLDVRDAATAQLDSGNRAIVPGETEASELIARITAADPDARMPPPESHKTLTAMEIETLRRWIAAGAEYQPHWSFVAPQLTALPEVATERWIRNEIDRFILARLETKGVTPADEASREKLIRRLSLDLLGLPPTPDEVEAFLLDNRPDAYERLVDRLLNSLHYGERMALAWLDAARYADTHGYHIDSHRDMWPWRDWVIDAYNQNMPFDQFTVWQLAGDLLPNATREQQVASGFHRNHPINYEGGAIPEEYHAEYVIDRVSTTGTVWMGLTLGCARCHDHKYDPVSQREFFELFAFFNTVDELGLDGQRGNAQPTTKVPTESQQQRVDTLTQQIAQLESQLAALERQLKAGQQAWEKSLRNREQPGAEIVVGDWYASEMYSAETAAAVFVTEFPPESWPVDFEGVDESGKPLWHPQPALIDGNVHSLSPEKRARYFARRLHASAPSELDLSVGCTDGMKLWLNGKLLLEEANDAPVALHRHRLTLPLTAGENVLVVKFVNYSWECEHFFTLRGRGRLSVPSGVEVLATKAAADRTNDEADRLRNYFRRSVSQDVAFGELDLQLADRRREMASLERATATTMVMREMAEPRDTFRLDRGQYDAPAERVTPATPAMLPPLPTGADANRLALARWLVDPAHPLTARVTVNRLWQLVFGTGLVKTSEDFGMQGEWPSHPELLDWLAVRFVESGWDVKAMLRLIVTSATYRQRSAVPSRLVTLDPHNRLLARGPRFRLQAELLRDLALSVSGLLDERIGGPSVKPYQPPDLWRELAHQKDNSKFTAQVFEQDHGADLYRRGMYTFWKRSLPPPNMAALDAPNREICVVRRETTNTPLQALVLLNDPTFVEAARALAERLLNDPAATTDERIHRAYALATSRLPRTDEMEIVTKELQRQVTVYRSDPVAAQALLAVGESPRNMSLDAAEHAAWTNVALMILNLDETITKE